MAARFDEVLTDRLRLRRWTDADREPFAIMNADPDVMEHFPAPPGTPGHGSYATLANVRSQAVMRWIGLERWGEFDHPRLDENSPLRCHVAYRAERPAP